MGKYIYHISVKKALLFALCALVFLTPLYASAKTLNDLKKEREAVAGQKDDAKSRLGEVSKAKSEAEIELEAIDAELSAVSDDFDETAALLETTEQLLNETILALDEAATRRQEQYEALKSRARFMYENGRLGLFEALFGSTSFEQFLSNAEYISRIVDRDSALLDALSATESVIADKKEETARHKAEAEALKAGLATKQAALDAALLVKKEAIEALDTDVEKYALQLASLDETSKSIEKLIKEKEAEEERKRKAEADARAKAVASGAAKYSGTLLWPAPSTSIITCGYGYRTNPISGKKEFHAGIDIGLSYGADIVAADSGVVIMAQTNGGYGKCVIIQHGGGLTTLYGHCSKLVVSEGQSVSRGEVIAKCGSTGYSTGPHLHFETRVSGNHVSPWNYLNK